MTSMYSQGATQKLELTSISNALRQAIIKTATEEGDDNSLWQTAESLVATCSGTFYTGNIETHELAPQLHDLWFLYYESSKHISSKSTAQDRLIVQILQIQAQGILSRGSNLPDITITADGTTWLDLPYFASDMFELWSQDCASMSTLHRVNFTHFLAKLASIGLLKDKLCTIALKVLRDTLEIQRPLKTPEINEESVTLQISDLSISDLLPAASMWIAKAGRRIIQLSEEDWADTDEFGEVGQFALLRSEQLPSQSGLLPGFNPRRWMFWLQRLDEIAIMAQDAGASETAMLARKTMDSMLFDVDRVHSAVKAEFDSNPSLVAYRPVGFRLLENLMKSRQTK